MKFTKKYYNLGKNLLFPLCRSITGNGFLKSLKIIKNEFPSLKIQKVPSNTKVFDWNVPAEWNVSDAYVVDNFGKKIIDFKKNNLHLMGYSIPTNKTVSKAELFSHICTLKNNKTAIPYTTSYYKKRWGFNISYNDRKFFNKKYKKNDKFKVVIKSSLNKNGNLNYGELTINGNSKEEILISTYLCHPSMANNELSGPIVAMSLINYLKKKNLEKTIRFVFLPETIGSIVFINKNFDNLKKNVIGGYNLSCIGDERMHSCMFSKYKNSPSDEALIEAYKKLNIKYKVYSFLERGSDERQYNSPGIDLPISSIFRSKYGTYPEYHTSLDNFDLVTPKGIEGGFKILKTSVDILLKKKIPKNLIMCEPKMDKRKLYHTLSIKTNYKFQKNMHFLQYADGKNSLEKISKLTKIDIKKVNKIYKNLKQIKLIN